MSDRDPLPFLRDFRHAAPYIRAHRGKTFVIVFGIRGRLTDETFLFVLFFTA